MNNTQSIHDILHRKSLLKFIIELNYIFRTLSFHLIDGILEDNMSNMHIN
jgi:hypothetical protein